MPVYNQAVGHGVWLVASVRQVVSETTVQAQNRRIGMSSTIEASEFLRVVRPALEAADAGMLAQAVRVRWRPGEICRLLRHPETDVRRVAAVTLGMMGDRNAVNCLVRSLRDEDALVNQMAEHALWSIWFRLCEPRAVQPFREGTTLLAGEKYKQAIEKFREAAALDPSFAEAYNQSGIAHYFVGEWEHTIHDCRRTVELMPGHFGAIAGMGHCHAQLGDLRQALRCYRWALRINPRMEAIAKAITRLRERVTDLDASGEFLVDVCGN